MVRKVFLDFDARREPKTDHCCIKCQRDLKPGQPFRVVALLSETMEIIHPDEPPQDGAQIWPLGMDCARRVGLEWSRPAEDTAPRPWMKASILDHGATR